MNLADINAKNWFGYIKVFSILAVAALTACGSNQDHGYVVVHGWPRLPEGLILGQVSGVEVDSHDHVFVFHRGRDAWFNGDHTVTYDGHMDWAHDVGVDSESNVYVADVHFGMRIQKFAK